MTYGCVCPGAAGLLALLMLTGVALAQGDGPEFLVDTTRQLVQTSAFDQNAGAAFNGTNHLLVWESGSDMRGTLVTPGGALLDSAGFGVLTSANCWSVKAAWGGGVFLVAFGRFVGQQYDVYALRLDASGQVLDTGGFVVCSAPLDQDEVDVCYDGTDFLVVWDDDRAGGDTICDIYAARVTTGGQVLDPNGFPVSTGSYEKRSPAVAFDGNNCLVVWDGAYYDTSYIDIWGARVTAGGAVLDPDPLLLAHYSEDSKMSPDVAFNGTNYLVAWDDGAHNHRIYCSRVSPAGSVLDTADVLVAGRSRECEYPAVRANGSDWLVVWDDDTYSTGQNLYGARVSAAGVSLDPSGFAVGGAAFEQGGGAVSFDGTNWLVAWGDGRQGLGTSDIYAARVTPSGAVLEPNGFAVSFGVNEQEYATVASDGSDFLVAWSDSRGEWDIYGARVSAGGSVLDPVPFNLSAVAGKQTNPAVAFDGTNYLVVWQDIRDTGNVNLYGARVSQAGAVIDSPAVKLTTTQYDDYWPRMTFDGVNYVIVWRYESSHHVWAMRVQPNLTVLDTNGFQVSFASGMQVLPDVAAADTMCLVTWEQGPGIYGARITRSGVLLDSSAVHIAGAPYFRNWARVAGNSANWLVVWSDQRSLRHCDVYAGIVDLDGSVRDTLGFVVSVSDSGRFKSMPDVVFDGTNYLLVWGDDRNHAPTYFDACGATVSPAGVVVDTFPVVKTPEQLWYPALAHSNQGAMLVYNARTGIIGGRNYDGRRVWGKMGPLPGVEEREKSEERRAKDGATVVRGVLFLPASPCPRVTASPCLLDVLGRKVLDLRPGANDLSRLSPGVYFLRSSIDNRQPPMSRVVLVR